MEKSITVLTEKLNNWLDQGFAASTRRNYRLGLQAFVAFMDAKEGGSWTVEKLKAARLQDLEKRTFRFEQLLVDFYEWLKTYQACQDVPFQRRGWKTGKTYSCVFHQKPHTPSDSERKVFLNGVRSFFCFHRLDLQLTRQQKRLIGKRARSVFNDYLFDLPDIKKMAAVGTPQEKYVLLVGKDVGLRAEDFARLTQGLFAQAIGKDPPVLLGEVYTQKEGIHAFPFLTADGVSAARAWLQILQAKGLRDDKASMLTIKAKELTENLRRLTAKAGIDTHGKRVRFHCLRKFLIDRISLTMSESKWKQIVGKEIDERSYVSPLKLRESYAEVMAHIQLMAPETLDLSTEDVVQLKEIARALREGRLQLLK